MTIFCLQTFLYYVQNALHYTKYCSFDSSLRVLDHSCKLSMLGWSGPQWRQNNGEIVNHYLVLVIVLTIQRRPGKGILTIPNHLFLRSTFFGIFQLILQWSLDLFGLIKKQIHRPLPLRILFVLLEGGLKLPQMTVI